MIYLDNHATTPLDPLVLEAMLPFYKECYGNAGSTHAFGTTAKDAVEKSRAQIAEYLGAKPREIVFTSGATESNNLAIHGVLTKKPAKPKHVISVITEHKAVLDPLAHFAKQGVQVTLLPVRQHPNGDSGRISIEQIEEAIREETALVSIMAANNEIGVLQPIAEIGALCQERGILFHSDATQFVGKMPVDVRSLGVDLMSFTAHKMHGPKGVGALYVRGRSPERGPAVRLCPQVFGGGQMEGRRSGTLNVPGIVGLAKALALCTHEMPEEISRLMSLRNRLADRLLSEIPEASLVGPSLEETDSHGHPIRLPGNLNLLFRGFSGESLMMQMPELAVSSGATCASETHEPSHVLTALGLSSDESQSCLRFGLGRFTTEKEIDQAGAWVIQAVQTLRNLL